MVLQTGEKPVVMQVMEIPGTAKGGEQLSVLQPERQLLVLQAEGQFQVLVPGGQLLVLQPRGHAAMSPASLRIAVDGWGYLKGWRTALGPAGCKGFKIFRRAFVYP